MPVPAEQVRRRGDAIRRRGHALVAAGSALAVAAVVVPVFALSGGNDTPGEPEPAPDPSPTITDPTEGGLSETNLMTDDDTVYDAESDWVADRTSRGEGESALNPCVTRPMTELGATTVVQRTYGLQSVGGGSDNVHGMHQVAAGFTSPGRAVDAYEAIAADLANCVPSATATGVRVTGPATVDVPVDGAAADMADVTWSSNAEEGGESYSDVRMVTGIVVSGDRLTVLSHRMPDADYGWTDGSPVERMLPAAAERLVLGAGEQPQDPGTAWPTEIPDGFPLASGMPEDDGSDEYRLEEPSEDNVAMVEAGALVACGEAVDGGDPVDRLTTRLTFGSMGRVRELQLFADDEDARAFLDAVQDLYTACETEGEAPTVTTTVTTGSVGEESWVILRATDGIGPGVIHVVRVGNAVLVESAGDERDGDDAAALADEAGEDLADVVRELYTLQDAGGTDDEGGSTQQEPTTTIPVGFPLDAAVGEPPVDGEEAAVEGPGPDVVGVNPQSICGADLALPSAGSPDSARGLGYAVSDLEGYDRRTIRAYPTARDAVAQMDRLRQQVTDCERDSGGDGLSDRLWQSFGSRTGYDSVTFGYTYEEADGVGASAGQLYTAVRVGNAILAVEWGGEWSADFMADAAPGQVDLVRLITPEMACAFSRGGC